MAPMKEGVFAITGGASGIGLSTAKLLHSRGASVSIGDIDAVALDAAVNIFAHEGKDDKLERVMLTRLDVGNRVEVDAWIKATVRRFGRLDGAANIAGVIGKHHGTRTVQELEDEQWDLIMKVNLTGMMYCLRAELREMGSGGSIVCASSVQGTMGFAKHAAYSASKHGIVGLARSAAKEVGERNIRVNIVAPGSINTPLMGKRNALPGVEPTYQETPINRLGSSTEVANLIVWLLSDEASFVTGGTFPVDGGWAC